MEFFMKCLNVYYNFYPPQNAMTIYCTINIFDGSESAPQLHCRFLRIKSDYFFGWNTGEVDSTSARKSTVPYRCYLHHAWVETTTAVSHSVERTKGCRCWIFYHLFTVQHRCLLLPHRKLSFEKCNLPFSKLICSWLTPVG